jgi:trehalose 6-phosphate phosphatase
LLVERQVSLLPSEVLEAFADVSVLEPSVTVENKGFALAFHYRQAPDREAALRALLIERLAPFRDTLSLMHGKSIFEIGPRGCTKGTAVRTLMHTAPFAGRRPVYLGDDTTDEYAFAALRDFGGIGVSVGRAMQHADCLADTPLTIRKWLDQIAASKEPL